MSESVDVNQQNIDLYHFVNSNRAAALPSEVPIVASAQTAEPVKAAEISVIKPSKEDTLRKRRFNRAVKDADTLLESLGMGINTSGQGQSR